MGAATTAIVAKRIFLALVFSKAASTLLSKKPDRLDDSKPATLAEVGSRLNSFVGRDRIAPLFVYESPIDRRIIFEQLNGGGGGKGVGAAANGSQNKVYLSSGVQILCVGPAHRLRKIVENGEQIWPTGNLYPLGITPETHPSGSGTFAVEPTDEGESRGTFKIYWGEPDQPVCEEITRNGELDITSRYGYQCYIYWKDKRLGGVGLWPTLEYDVEVRPFNPAQTYANSLLGTTYNSMTPQLGGGSAAWLENGTVVDENQCFTILKVEADPVNVITVVGGGFWAFTGEDVYVKDSPRNSFDGFLSTSSFTSGGTLTSPSSVFVRRDIKLNPLDWTRNALFTSISDLTGTSGPPGVVTSSITGNVPIFQLSKVLGGSPAFISLASFESFTGFPLPDPDTNTAGGQAEFNGGYNYFTFYTQATASGPSLRQILQASFEGGSLPRYVELTMHSGLLQSANTFNGALVLTESLGNRWYKVLMGYKTLSGGETNPLSVRYTIPASSPALSVVITHGRGLSNTDALLRYRSAQSGVVTRLIMNEVLPESFDNTLEYIGQVCRLKTGPEGPQGANAAHIVYQRLFESAPHGLGLDTNHYDLQSLQDLGNLLENEGLRSHTPTTQGDKLDAELTALASECGFQRVWNFSTGLWEFVPIRESVTIIDIPKEALVGPRPKRDSKLGDSDSVAFNFQYKEETRGYRNDLISSPSTSNEFSEIEQVTIRTVRDREAALVIGDRLELIERSNPRLRTQRISRQSLELAVGDLIRFPDEGTFTVPSRIVTMLPNTSASEVLFECATDTYAVDPQPFSPARVGSLGFLQADASPVPADEIVDLWEVSAYLTYEISIAVFRVPSTVESSEAFLQGSLNNVNYTDVGISSALGAGILIDDFSATYEEDGYRRHYIEKGPVIKAVGDPFREATSAKTDAAWRAGQQWLWVNGEIMYVREFISFGDDVWRAEGVLRGQLDTELLSHAYGSGVYVMDGVEVPAVQVLGTSRGFPVYVKTIPRARGRQADVANMTLESLTPVGKSIRPMDVENLRTENFTPAFVEDFPVTIKWSPRVQNALSTRTGFGMQGLGEETSSGRFPGTFTVAVSNIGGTVLEGPLTVFEPEVELSGEWSVDVNVSVIPVYSDGTAGDRKVLLLTKL
jgi:hypothetical protein